MNTANIYIYIYIYIYMGPQGSKAGTGPKGYYRCRQIIATNLLKHRLTRHRSALPANPTSSRPRSWSLGNATLVVAERSGWRRVLGASKPRPSAKRAHRYRKRACLEVLRLATTKLTKRGTGYPSWGHPTQLRISRGSTGLVIHPEDTLPNSESPEEAQDWFSILMTPYPTQNLQRKRRTGYPSWGHPTQLRISRGSTGLVIHPEDTLPNSEYPEEAQDLLSILRTPYPTQNIQRKHRTDYPSWGHPTQLRISRGSTGLIIHPEDTLPNSESPEEAQDRFTNAN